MRHFAVLLTTLIIITLMFSACTKSEQALTGAELLDLGEKYLLEMDYEQALVQFLKVIEVEPMNPRGYTGAAEAYFALGENQKAADVLQKKLEVLSGNATIQKSLDEFFESSTAEPESSLDSESKIEQLAEKLLSIYESHGYGNILDEMRSDEFDATISSALNESENEPIICNTSESIGCGFYMVGDEIFVYLGAYVDLSRSGSGVWLHVNETDKGYYVFTGIWFDDMPNGEGQVISVLDESAIEKQEGYTYGLKITTTGTYLNGLLNGMINEQWLMDDGHTHNWNLTAVNGYYSVTNSVDLSDVTIGFCTECGADLIDDSLNGVKGFMH